MPRICYVPRVFRDDTLRIIEQADSIAQTYATQGYDLTLRQTYYQFVSRGLLANNERNYKRLGAIINDARLAGLIDWDHITDRTRWVRDNPHWDTPEEMLKAAAKQYANEKWNNQPARPIVLIEKDALAGVIAGVCEELDVPYFPCRGYSSQSELWSTAYYRLGKYIENDQLPVILYLGDHDPSGIDMTRDVRDRFALFIGHDYGEEWVPRVIRLALNMDQIRQYNPPPNPAKSEDTRFEDYKALHGTSSWELDALDPPVIAQLVRDAIEKVRNQDLWEEATGQEEETRKQLDTIHERWPEVIAFLNNGNGGK